MDISVSPSALKWLKSELTVRTGDDIRLFVKYGGSGGPTQGFSLGISKEKPRDIGVSTVIENITFYMEEQDLWYLDDHDVFIRTNDVDGDLEFIYR